MAVNHVWHLRDYLMAVSALGSIIISGTSLLVSKRSLKISEDSFKISESNANQAKISFLLNYVERALSDIEKIMNTDEFKNHDIHKVNDLYRRLVTFTELIEVEGGNEDSKIYQVFWLNSDSQLWREIPRGTIAKLAIEKYTNPLSAEDDNFSTMFAQFKCNPQQIDWTVKNLTDSHKTIREKFWKLCLKYIAKKEDRLSELDPSLNPK